MGSSTSALNPFPISIDYSHLLKKHILQLC